MKFNHDYKPNRDNLSPLIAALMSKTFYARRDQGLNVQFNNNGNLDEWSFANAMQRDQFIAALQRKNEDYAEI